MIRNLFLSVLFTVSFQVAHSQEKVVNSVEDYRDSEVRVTTVGSINTTRKVTIVEETIRYEEVCDELIPDGVETNNGFLSLTGVGQRKAKKWGMTATVYVAALYTDGIYSNPYEIIDSESDKQIDIYFSRDLSKDQIKDSYEWKDGLKEQGLFDVEENFDINALYDAVLSDVKEGQKMTILVSDDEVTFFLDNEPLYTVYSSNFATALLRVYLLKNPPHSKLSEELLGYATPSC